MAFTQGIIPGKAKELYIGGRKEEDVYLELDLKKGVINTYIPRLEYFPSKIHKKLLKEKNISLKEVEFYLPAGKLMAKSRTPSLDIGGKVFNENEGNGPRPDSFIFSIVRKTPVKAFHPMLYVSKKPHFY